MLLDSAKMCYITEKDLLVVSVQHWLSYLTIGIAVIIVITKPGCSVFFDFLQRTNVTVNPANARIMRTFGEGVDFLERDGVEWV